VIFLIGILLIVMGIANVVGSFWHIDHIQGSAILMCMTGALLCVYDYVIWKRGR
jgi:uncharacterized membrane protein HdeD (DUF308 family)